MDLLDFFIALIDFGMVILIWMTQWVVYPGFMYFRQEDLMRWHPKYTSSIYYLVMVLMTAQVSLHVLKLFLHFDWWQAISLVLIGLAWVNTFLFAVPLHQKISRNIDLSASITGLIRTNRYRAVLWSVVWMISLVTILRNQGLFD